MRSNQADRNVTSPVSGDGAYCEQVLRPRMVNQRLPLCAINRFVAISKIGDHAFNGEHQATD